MADFKLVDVAKKINISAEEALKRLEAAGEKLSGGDATISVEQMRILGVNPQHMIDRRKERLQQALERRTRGSMGKEIVVNSRKEEAAPTPRTRISKEEMQKELQKRKTELNKELLRVDEDRQQYLKQKDEDDDFIEEKEMVQESVEQTVQEEVKVETKEEVKEQDKDKSKEQEAKPRKPAQETRTLTPRPLGPAGYVPRENTQGQRPRTEQRRTQDGRPYQRPTGPAADRDRPQRGDRRGTPQGDRPQRIDRDKDSSPRDSRGGAPRSTKQTFPSRSEAIVPEEERRWESKKTREPEVAAKEEAKKVKSKTERPKDLSKTIIEGMNELDIEKEIEVEVVEDVVVEPKPVYPGKTERKQRKKFERNKEPHVIPRPTHITIGETVVVSELAGMIGIKAAELVKKLFTSGVIATVNQSINAETASLLCMDYGVEVSTKIITEEDLLPVYEDKPEDLVRRPPVVTVMGHVDHGKTSLLDAIRSAAVAEREAGGITQHIGAYEVELNGRKITFLDTPGHEAFTSLRARGAQVTDIVILVVAANDGVMPQTKEAIDHAKAAGVKIVVAINKIDRPDANPDKVRQQLADYGIISDEWGGEYQFQEISAKNRIGIEDLLERVLLEADVLELKGNPNRPAEGIIIESQLDKQKGATATVLVKNGTLRRGDIFVVGSQMGKVRSMQNYRGVVTKEAGISMPVEVMGFSSVPESGDFLLAVEDEKLAKSIADLRAKNKHESKQASSGVITLSDFFNKVKEGEVKELNIIIKSDVQGSLEALKSSLLKLSNIEVKVNVVHDATGGINESDVVLAMASKAIIIGFNVRPDNNAKSLAEKEGISIELYSVIYQAIEDVKLALEGMLTPDSKENILGKVEVRQVFSVPKLGKIAGAYVQEGKVLRNSLVRVIRDNVVIFSGKLGSLKRFTDDVKEVTHGYECGLSIDRYQDIKEKDILEIYEIVQEKRTLEDVKARETARAKEEKE